MAFYPMPDLPSQTVERLTIQLAEVKLRHEPLIQGYRTAVAAHSAKMSPWYSYTAYQSSVDQEEIRISVLSRHPDLAADLAESEAHFEHLLANPVPKPNGDYPVMDYQIQADYSLAIGEIDAIKTPLDLLENFIEAKDELLEKLYKHHHHLNEMQKDAIDFAHQTVSDEQMANLKQYLASASGGDREVFEILLSILDSYNYDQSDDYREQVIFNCEIPLLPTHKGAKPGIISSSNQPIDTTPLYRHRWLPWSVLSVDKINLSLTDHQRQVLMINQVEIQEFNLRGAQIRDLMSRETFDCYRSALRLAIN